MEASQITRLDSQRSKGAINKKINTEIIEELTQMKSTCPHQEPFSKDQGAMEEPAKRIKTKIHRSLKKLDHKRSRVKRELYNTSTKIRRK